MLAWNRFLVGYLFIRYGVIVQTTPSVSMYALVSHCATLAFIWNSVIMLGIALDSKLWLKLAKNAPVIRIISIIFLLVF